jgi:signal transduction histidine kinase
MLYASVGSALGGLPPAATPADVQHALATSLHDPALEVLYWVEDARGYVDTRGSAVPEHRSQERLDITSEASDGSPLAIIRVDASAHRHPELLASALRLGTLALENARLQAALLAQLTAVQESRARIVEATLAERRRIERDLHDGAQQRLLATATTLGRLHHRAQDPTLRAIVDEARDQLRDSLEQLRDLAHGIHPALLTEGGLRPAIASVAEGLPMPVHLAVPNRRWPPNVEATAYFVICEALTNAAKHSGSHRVDVRVEGDDHVFQLTLSDDGIGGASAGSAGGLRGLHDRVAALGGQLTLSSARDSGTRIKVMLPCG